jgi:hypothetical protein
VKRTSIIICRRRGRGTHTQNSTGRRDLPVIRFTLLRATKIKIIMQKPPYLCRCNISRCNISRCNISAISVGAISVQYQSVQYQCNISRCNISPHGNSVYIRTWTSLHCIQNTAFSKSFCIHLSNGTTLPQNAVYILKSQSTYKCNDLNTARGNRLQHICHFDGRNSTQNACQYTPYLYEFQVTLLYNKKQPH